ncbi:hypothetical protein JXM83_00085 [Candidatus Woesearchaeota archaeon]|nr:hypothetical protein [Candidatus Delongbacteria bacterium]MBN2880430.1 hypothetical protein [Candidatus Woesearchaeota archaeon]
MKKNFRLYTDNRKEYNSSIFDLINGDKETKQTKGLAYILSQYTDFLFLLLEYKPIKEILKEKLGFDFDKKSLTAIEVSAERITIDKKRADIVIKLDALKKPLIAIIIEAKSIKVNVNQQSLSKQILEYLGDKTFPDLIHYPKVGIALTKYNQSIPEIANVSWENLIQLLFGFCKTKKSEEIVYQYLKFITEIDKAMKYYEKEVLSIPAAKSLDLVERFNIYVCPDTKDYNYKKPIFVGFRKGGGGVMEKLYKIEDIIILNPTVESEIETLRYSVYSDEVKARILNYIKETNYKVKIDYDEKFYILSESETIVLHNKPKPKRNNAKFTYYTLSEVLTKEIIVPESQQ